MTGPLPESDSPRVGTTPDGEEHTPWPQFLRLLPLLLSCALSGIGMLCLILSLHNLAHAPVFVSVGFFGGAAVTLSLSLVSFRE